MFTNVSSYHDMINDFGSTVSANDLCTTLIGNNFINFIYLQIICKYFQLL